MQQPYQAAADLLANRVILVTGAGDGIGRSAALAFAGYGASVVLLGRTVRKLEAVYDAIEENGHPRPAIVPLNLETASPKDYADVASAVEQEFGRLDGLLHNAAILGNLSPITHYDIELWHKVMQVNLNAPFMLTQALLPLLMRAEDASIVFTVHRVAEQGRAYWGAYGAAKAGLLGLARTLSSELEDNTGVRVNAVEPGEIHSGMRIRAYPGGDRSTWSPPESLLPLYLYLMGPDSRKVTGRCLTVSDLPQSES